ncbi:MAG: toxin [Vicinamibacterales bacterium]
MAQKESIRWNLEKNVELMLERGISFEEILSSIEQGGLLATLEHSNRRKYPNQRIWVVKVRGYAHLVPFVESEGEIFLKTIMPSRKATKQFIGEVDDES